MGRGEADVPTHLQHDLSCAEGMQPESNHDQSLTLGIFFLRISLLKGLNQPCETSGPAYSDFMERFYYAWVSNYNWCNVNTCISNDFGKIRD